jgi:hypothetical protein
MLQGSISTGARPEAIWRSWSIPVQKAASAAAAASPRAASRPGLWGRLVHCADRRFAPARKTCRVPTGPPRRRLVCLCSSLVISLFSSGCGAGLPAKPNRKIRRIYFSFRAISAGRPAPEGIGGAAASQFSAQWGLRRDETRFDWNHLQRTQAGARLPSGPVTVSPSRASISAVMLARSNRGAKPQSVRAALSSSERGQESAIDWRTGST